MLFPSYVHREEEQNKRIAVVASGGGTSSAYTLGFFEALEEHFGFINPDLLIGASGSTPIIACYASRQMDICAKYWTEEVPHIMLQQGLLYAEKKDAIWLAKMRDAISRFDYQTIFESKIDIERVVNYMRNNINIAALEGSAIDVLFAVTDVETGAGSFITNREGKSIEAIHASIAIPVAYGKHVEIYRKEQLRKHIDGELSTPVEESIREAARRKIGTIIAVDTTNVLTLKTLGLLGRALGDATVLKAFMYRARRSLPPEWDHPDVKIIYQRPQKPLRTHILNNSLEVIEESRHQGYVDALNNRELNEAMNDNAKRIQVVAA
jgi:predicted acylesterase/phospholipase RssA